MDKTKILAILALAIAGGAVVLSKSPQTPPGASGAAHDHNNDGASDHGDEAHSGSSTNTATEASSTTDLAGGVTALKKEDLRAGDGPAAASGDNLTMNYRGKLLNGKEFDASYGREPFQFQLGGGQVIKGWDEGIKGMKQGGKRKLTIPASLGYGDRGAGADIPPGATLVFEVELLKVDKAPK